MKTVSLELAKQLKEAGYPQEGAFYWVEFEHNSEYEDPGIVERTDLYSREEINKKSGSRNFWEMMERGKGVDDIVASPTADEILDQLPYRLEGSYIFAGKERWGNKMVWIVGYEGKKVLSSDSISDSASRCWLYLKKEGLLDTDEDMSEKQPFTK